MSAPSPLSGLWQAAVFAKPAVDVFIILSGFAITFQLETKPQNYLTFIGGRFFRIYPTYAVALGAAVGASFLVPGLVASLPWKADGYFDGLRRVSASEASHFSGNLLAHLLLLHGLIPRSVIALASVTLLAPAWSISLEWQYYLVAPWIGRLCRSALGLVGLCGAAAISQRYCSAWENPMVSFLLPRLPLFLIGIGSFWIYARAETDGPRSWFRTAFPVAMTGAVMLIAPNYALALSLWTLALSCTITRGPGPIPLVLAFVRQYLASAPAQWLGRLSYIIYLVHWPLLIIFMTAILNYFPAVTKAEASFILIVVGLPTILVVAAQLHRLIEKPGMDLGRRLFQRETA